MAEKKYYWLKLKDDFFKQKEIKKLRSIAGGDTYTIIYLKMGLLSLKNEGVIHYDGTEKNLAEQLSWELDEDINNIEVTLSFLQAHGLLEILESDADYLLPKFSECIGSEGSSAERMRRLRASKQASLCDGTVTVCDTEKEKEKEKEIRNRDKEIYNEFNKIILAKYPGRKTKDTRDKKVPKLLKEYSIEELTRCIERYTRDCRGKEKQYILNESTFWNGRYKDYLDCNYEGDRGMGYGSVSEANITVTTNRVCNTGVHDDFFNGED